MVRTVPPSYNHLSSTFSSRDAKSVVTVPNLCATIAVSVGEMSSALTILYQNVEDPIGSRVHVLVAQGQRRETGSVLDVGVVRPATVDQETTPLRRLEALMA
jgi:hypothetical protein